MKHLPFIALTFLAVALGASAQDNLVSNGNIDAIDDNQTGGWTTSLADYREGKAVPPAEVPEAERLHAEFRVVPAADSAGKMLSVEVASGDGRAAWCFAVPNAAGKLKPGQKYRFSFKMKYKLAKEPEEGSGVTARLNLWDGKWKNLLELYVLPTGNYAPLKQKIPAPPVSGDWKEYSAVFTAPEGVARSAGHIGLSGVAGELFADDFQLIEVADDTPEGPFQ